VVPPAVNVADASFSPIPNGNKSKNKVAIQECAPLDPSTSANLEQANSALINFLLGKYCPFCNAAIFQQVEIGTTQAEFTSYLQQGHEFCNGPKTMAPGGIIGSKKDTVADDFDSDTTAATVATGLKTFPIFSQLNFWPFKLLAYSSSERKTWRTYFNPSKLANRTLTMNESTLFHESLHGFTGLGDGGKPGFSPRLMRCSWPNA
jgi:hypothetical protein